MLDSDLDGKGNSALHIAAKDGNMELVEVLLEHGADLNKKNKLNKTPDEVGVENTATTILAYGQGYYGKKEVNDVLLEKRIEKAFSKIEESNDNTKDAEAKKAIEKLFSEQSNHQHFQAALKKHISKNPRCHEKGGIHSKRR